MDGGRHAGLVGYDVYGRRGYLGTVVGEHGEGEGGEVASILVRGGISDALVFHLPATCVVSVSPSTHTVTVAADVADFVPRLGTGGTVELHIVR